MSDLSPAICCTDLLVPFTKEAALVQKYLFENLSQFGCNHLSTTPLVFVIPIQAPLLGAAEEVDTNNPLAALQHLEVLRQVVV
jgi:hypothetical protein